MTASLPEARPESIEVAQALLRRAEEAIGDRCFKCGDPVLRWGGCLKSSSGYHQISDAHWKTIHAKEFWLDKDTKETP